MKATFRHVNYPPKKLSKKKDVLLSKNLEKKYFKSILNYTKRKLLIRIMKKNQHTQCFKLVKRILVTTHCCIFHKGCFVTFQFFDSFVFHYAVSRSASICSLYINVRNRKKVNTFSYSLIEHSVFIIYMIYVYI